MSTPTSTTQVATAVAVWLADEGLEPVVFTLVNGQTVSMLRDKASPSVVKIMRKNGSTRTCWTNCRMKSEKRNKITLTYL